jgi:hypothetical protein
MLASFAASAQAIANAGHSLNNMAVANKSAFDKMNEKRQATSKWLPSAIFLLKLLSAEDVWDTQGVPEITEFAEKLSGSYSETDSQDFGMQQVQETFGDGDPPKDMIKAFSKLHIFVPENTYKATEQLQVAISFLESVCGEMTIATAGYKRGLRYLTLNQMLFESQDTLFLLNYL